ncbi:MAG: nucleotide exchange factor GrpE [Bacillota bacterium]
MTKKMDNNEETVEYKNIPEENSTDSVKQEETPGEPTEPEQLQKQIDELNQRLMRVAADFDNYRKRTRLEKEEFAKYANSSLVSELLPVLDNFQRALDVKEPSEEVKKFLSGIEMIYKQLWQVLNQSGLEAINAVGDIFNPEKHEAVMQVEDDSVDDNTVIEELRGGYMYKDKIIRPSMVKVAISHKN